MLCRNQHFRNIPHSVKFKQTSATDSNPWVQDYVKSGKVNGETRVLLPRRLLEGSAEYGERFCSFLDELTSGTFVRSKLSWEGGDIQFMNHPRFPDETILFYGDTANAPMIEQCPINMECEVQHILDLGSHALVVGKVIEVHFTEECMTDDKPDIGKVKPFIFGPGKYYEVGGAFADAFKIGNEIKGGR